MGQVKMRRVKDTRAPVIYKLPKEMRRPARLQHLKSEIVIIQIKLGNLKGRIDSGSLSPEKKAEFKQTKADFEERLAVLLRRQAILSKSAGEKN